MQTKELTLGFRTFLIGALALEILVFFAAKQVHMRPLWFLVLCIFLLAVPIALSGLYIGTVNQVHRLTFFTTTGRMYKLLSGRVIGTIFWVTWALVTAFLMLLQLNLYSPLEWLSFFLTIPLYWVVLAIVRSRLSTEVRKQYAITSQSLQWTGYIAPVVMLLIYALLLRYFSEVHDPLTLHETISAKRAHLLAHRGSAVVEEALQILTALAGVKDFAQGKLNRLPWFIPWLISVLGSLVIFFNACSIFSCLMIPASEYRRVFGPLTDESPPPKVPHSRIAITASIVGFLTLFAYVPLFAALENWVRQSPDWISTREELESLIVTKVDEIDGSIFKPGTIAQIEAARARAFRKVEVALDEVERIIDQGFSRVEGNVDSYLDWYYSLKAEYIRIGTLLAGTTESYMAEKLTGFLSKGDPLKDVVVAMEAAIKLNEIASKEYQDAVRIILADNKLAPLDVPTAVTRRISKKEAWELPVHPGVITLKGRLAGSVAAAGVMTGAIAYKIFTKVVGKSLYKFAAKLIAKAATSKLTSLGVGATEGAAAGAAVGSFVPGIGTAIGAAVGGVIGGVAVAVATDKGLLMLEEKLNREKFKAEIIASISEVKMAFKKEVLGR